LTKVVKFAIIIYMELPPGAYPLMQPRKEYDPTDFDLHPDTSEGDRWIVDASLNDEILLLLIRQKEELGRLHAEGQAGSDYKDRMDKLGIDIGRREGFLDRLDARP
jgi:hypothetical protein